MTYDDKKKVISECEKTMKDTDTLAWVLTVAAVAFLAHNWMLSSGSPMGLWGVLTMNVVAFVWGAGVVFVLALAIHMATYHFFLRKPILTMIAESYERKYGIDFKFLIW